MAHDQRRPASARQHRPTTIHTQSPSATAVSMSQFSPGPSQFGGGGGGASTSWAGGGLSMETGRSWSQGGEGMLGTTLFPEAIYQNSTLLTTQPHPPHQLQQPLNLLPAFEPAPNPPLQNGVRLLPSANRSDPLQQNWASESQPFVPSPSPSAAFAQQPPPRSTPWNSNFNSPAQPQLSYSNSTHLQTPGGQGLAENSPSWTRLEVPTSRQNYLDYFSASSGSLSPFPTSPSSSMASTIVATDSPAPPFTSVEDDHSPRPFLSAVHTGLNQDGEPLLPFPVLPGTNHPNLASFADSVTTHSCRHCREKKRKCQSPNSNTQCLSCFEKNFACGYVEQSTRKEGRKDIDPTRISKIKRWSLREGLEEARPPLVRLVETEAETSRLLHKKFVGKSKPNTDPFTFLTCSRAIELGYAILNLSPHPSASNSTSSLPSTTTSTPASLHPPLPSPGLHPIHTSYLQHPYPTSAGQTLNHSVSTSSLPSTISSSSLYTPSPSSSYNQYRLPSIPPPAPTRADSFPSSVGRGGGGPGTPLSYPGSHVSVGEMGQMGRGGEVVMGSGGGSKRRRTNPDGMIALGMIGLGIESGRERREEGEGQGEFEVLIR